jgi:hypothetical protein
VQTKGKPADELSSKARAVADTTKAVAASGLAQSKIRGELERRLRQIQTRLEDVRRMSGSMRYTVLQDTVLHGAITEQDRSACLSLLSLYDPGAVIPASTIRADIERAAALSAPAETDDDKRARLEAFRAEARSRPC